MDPATEAGVVPEPEPEPRLMSPTLIALAGVAAQRAAVEADPSGEGESKATKSSILKPRSSENLLIETGPAAEQLPQGG